jgi:hypothetical protein
MEPSISKRIPIAKFAWGVLRDSYHGTICLKYRPEHIGIAVIYYTLQLYGLEVPLSNEAEYKWWEVRIEVLLRFRNLYNSNSDLNFKMDSHVGQGHFQFKLNDEHFQTDKPHLCVNEYRYSKSELHIRWQSWRIAGHRVGPRC